MGHIYQNAFTLRFWCFHLCKASEGLGSKLYAKIKSESTPQNNGPCQKVKALPITWEPVYSPLLLPHPVPFLHIRPVRGNEKNKSVSNKHKQVEQVCLRW